MLEEKYGKLINLKPFNDDVGIVDTTQQKNVKQLQDISDEEGLKRAYETRYGLYQHYSKLFIAGTKDFPQDRIDDLKLPFDDTLNKTKRGRGAGAYYRSHHEIDTVIGHSLGGAVSLALEKQYKQQGNNPYGIIQSKTFGAPTESGNIVTIIKRHNQNEIVGSGVAGGLSIGGTMDSTIGFADAGLLSGLGADIGKKISSDFANRITEDTNTSPDIVRSFGDSVSMFDFNAKTVMPSMGFRWNDSAHSYKELFIKDAVPLHDTPKNMLQTSPGDSEATVITE